MDNSYNEWNKFYISNVLPDWFEIMPEPVQIENRHLIDITKPVGYDGFYILQQEMKRNPSTSSCRSNLSNPKFVSSPWEKLTKN